MERGELSYAKVRALTRVACLPAEVGQMFRNFSGGRFCRNVEC